MPGSGADITRCHPRYQNEWLGLACIAVVFFLGACDTTDSSPEGTIYGTVRVALTETPIPGVELRIAGASTISAADGTYRFDHIPVGNRELTAAGPGLQPWTSDVRITEGRLIFDPRMIRVGRVGGFVNDRRGEPVSGAHVLLDDRSVESREDGYFEFAEVTEGVHALDVRHPLFERHAQPVDVLSEGATLEVYLAAILCPSPRILVSAPLKAGKPGVMNRIGLEWVPISANYDRICSRTRVAWKQVMNWPPQDSVDVSLQDGALVVEDLPTGRFRFEVATINIDDVAGVPSVTKYLPSWVIPLTRIEAGTFMMGNDSGDLAERPAHEVTITRPFWLGATEVTNAQYLAAMTDPGGLHTVSDLPRQTHSRSEVVEGLNVLSAVEGLDPCYTADLEPVAGFPDCEGYRLPTEAEWEYAVRAGTTTPYFFGDNWQNLALYAWTLWTSGSVTRSVGKLRPNPWGLHDVYGNVEEWVQDDWSNGFDGTDARVDPLLRSPGSTMGVTRGGGLLPPDQANRYRSSYRMPRDVNDSDVYVGFRVARTIR